MPTRKHELAATGSKPKRLQSLGTLHRLRGHAEARLVLELGKMESLADACKWIADGAEAILARVEATLRGLITYDPFDYDEQYCWEVVYERDTLGAWRAIRDRIDTMLQVAHEIRLQSYDPWEPASKNFDLWVEALLEIQFDLKIAERAFSDTPTIPEAAHALWEFEAGAELAEIAKSATRHAMLAENKRRKFNTPNLCGFTSSLAEQVERNSMRESDPRGITSPVSPNTPTPHVAGKPCEEEKPPSAAEAVDLINELCQIGDLLLMHCPIESLAQERLPSDAAEKAIRLQHVGREHLRKVKQIKELLLTTRPPETEWRVWRETLNEVDSVLTKYFTLVSNEEEIVRYGSLRAEIVTVRDEFRYLAKSVEQHKQPAVELNEQGDDQPEGQSGSKGLGQGRRKRVTVSERITLEATRNPPSIGWSAETWASHLRCSKSAVIESKAWNSIVIAARAIQEANRQTKSSRRSEEE